MNKHGIFGLVLIGGLAASPLTWADNVVVTPSQPAPAPQPPPVVQTPTVVEPAPVVQPAPLVVEPGRRTEVHADVSPPHNYVETIAVSAFAGALTGGLIGGAIYLLDNQTHPYNIAYWAAGGTLVGTGLGVVQIMVQESRVSEATSLHLNHLPGDPAPTYRLALCRVHF
jgi:hypothetical protein